MEQNYVVLTTAANSFQKSLIEEILRNSGIPFLTQNPTPTVYLGAESPLSLEKVLVPADRLQEAKENLCANGVVCEVSGRLLNRALEEIVKPLLGDRERDLSLLMRFVEINNKETVRALFEATMKEQGGPDLLEDLFFALARHGTAGLKVLARAARPKMNAAFSDRFHSEGTLGEKSLRLTLLDVLPELPPTQQRLQVLAAGLRDRDSEIREAASEALFSAEENDHGYDPSDPPAEREAAVQKLLGGSSRRS